MFGLMMLGAAALYLGLMFVVTHWAWRQVRVSGGSMRKAAAYVIFGFLIVFLPLFWQFVPTRVLHHRYCASDAGFVVHVPAETWRTQHRREIEIARQLPRPQREATPRRQDVTGGFSRDTHFNGLLASDFKAEQLGDWGAVVKRLTWRTVDADSGHVLATAIDYQSGYNDLRFWLNADSCVNQAPIEVGQPVLPTRPLDFHQLFNRQLQGE